MIYTGITGFLVATVGVLMLAGYKFMEWVDKPECPWRDPYGARCERTAGHRGNCLTVPPSRYFNKRTTGRGKFRPVASWYGINYEDKR